MSEKRILVCEDETILRIWLRQQFKRQGYDVLEAQDGEAAVAIATSQVVDSIIMDIKMPKRDGLAASADIMRQRPVAIIVLTAYGEAQTVARALEAGVSWYLVKPVEAAQLAPAMVMAQAKFQEMMALRKQVASLEDALALRKLLDKAKGILMRELGLDEAGAHQFLQRLSSQQSLPLKETAERVIVAANTIGQAASFQ